MIFIVKIAFYVTDAAADADAFVTYPLGKPQFQSKYMNNGNGDGHKDNGLPMTQHTGLGTTAAPTEALWTIYGIAADDGDFNTAGASRPYLVAAFRVCARQNMPRTAHCA